jgi:hypothetical protein
VLVAEAPIPMDYGPWKKMSQEGVDFLHACLDRDYHQRMTVRQVRGWRCAAASAATSHNVPHVTLHLVVLFLEEVWGGVHVARCLKVAPCCVMLCCRR